MSMPLHPHNLGFVHILLDRFPYKEASGLSPALLPLPVLLVIIPSNVASKSYGSDIMIQIPELKRYNKIFWVCTPPSQRPQIFFLLSHALLKSLLISIRHKLTLQNSQITNSLNSPYILSHLCSFETHLKSYKV